MKILVLGSGGREHALAWKLSRSAEVEQVYGAPGNAGMAEDGVLLESADLSRPAQVAELAARLGARLTVVGPEAPLVAGVVDEFQARGLAIVGPTRAAARLEGSKIFAKEFMRRHAIPTADFVVAETIEEGRSDLRRFGFPVVLKADGLAAGKGVVVARDAAEAEQALEGLMSGRLVGQSGRRLVIEQFLPGEEVTFTVLTDGRALLALAPTQDHKAVFDDDRGPNTGGMGAYSDDGILSDVLRNTILEKIVGPTLAGMAAEGTPYSGVLYFGLMITAGVPRVLEYNVRFGDPETQPLMTRLSGDLLPLLLATVPKRGGLDTARAEWSPGATVCVVAASAGYPGAYERNLRITGLEDAERLPGVKVFHAGTVRGQDGFYTAGGRVLGITASGGELAEAISRAYAAAEKIRFQGMHYRRDIGRKGLGRARGPAPTKCDVRV